MKYAIKFGTWAVMGNGKYSYDRIGFKIFGVLVMTPLCRRFDHGESKYEYYSKRMGGGQ